jgi:hypothetical protein
LVESLEIHRVCERRNKGGEKVFTVWMGMDAGEMIEEREDRGKRVRSFTVGPWVSLGQHRSNRCGAPVRPVTP